MAAARQCDICGNYYVRGKDDNYIEIGRLASNNNLDKRVLHDTCPRCMESIKAHIDMLRQRGE